MIVNVVQILPMETLREVQKPTPGCLLQRYRKCNRAKRESVSSMMIAHGKCISIYFLESLNQNFLLMFVCNNIQPVLLKMLGM